jgi:hypothetical protein
MCRNDPIGGNASVDVYVSENGDFLYANDDFKKMPSCVTLYYLGRNLSPML